MSSIYFCPISPNSLPKNRRLSTIKALDEFLRFGNQRAVPYKNGNPLVQGSGLQIQNALRAGGCRTARLLGQKGHRRTFIDQPQFAGSLVWVFAVRRVVIDAAGEQVAVDPLVPLPFTAPRSSALLDQGDEIGDELFFW